MHKVKCYVLNIALQLLETFERVRFDARIERLQLTCQQEDFRKIDAHLIQITGSVGVQLSLLPNTVPGGLGMMEFLGLNNHEIFLPLFQY